MNVLIFSSKKETMRTATVQRKTKETNISVALRIDGAGKYSVSTGIGFLDHMLELFARHGMFDIELKCKGDLRVDDHHTTEDVAIALGQAFAKALKERAGIARYGSAYVPMDETLARCVVDLGGRSTLVFKAEFNRKTVGDLSTEIIKHFFHSFAENIKANIHVEVLYGSNTHQRSKRCSKRWRGRFALPARTMQE